MGLQLGLTNPIIVEALTEGLQASDQRLMRAIAPKTLTEWYSTMTRIKGTSSLPTPSEPFQGVSNTSAFHRDTGTPSRGRNYNPFSTNNTPRYPSGARRPPSPCKYCQGDHWNNECSMNRRPYRQQAYHGQPTAHYFPPERNGAHNLPVPAPRPYRTSLSDQREIQEQIGKMLEYDIIEPSSSPYSSPVTLVTKKDKTKRFCVDYRRLNEIIFPDVHPLPLIENILDKLANAKIYSRADFSSAYWSIEISPPDRNLLSFVTLEGQYNFKRLPYGIKIGPQCLEKVLQCGRPKRLLSDRAPAFTSPKFRRFLIKNGIQPLLTTANNPQANGLCERLNATLTGKLRLLNLENPGTSWTKLIKIVTNKYNDTPHTITGFPPVFLMYNIIPSDLNNHLNPYPNIIESRKLAIQRTNDRHDKEKLKYDSKHKNPHFDTGDLVLVKAYHHPNSGKLVPYFTGPYEITEIISDNVVRINRPNRITGNDSDTVHSDAVIRSARASATPVVRLPSSVVYLFLLELPSRPASVSCCPSAGIPSRTHYHDCPAHSTSDSATESDMTLRSYKGSEIINSFLKGYYECYIHIPRLCLQVFWIFFDFYLLKKMDQRTCIKFCVKNEIKCADAFRMLAVAYGEATLDRSNVYRWYKMFSDGR
ncbi:hypothetical protein LAZ67_3002733 [Cordylochernes scorpioides]|uniref:Integrase catalytic domain-containing protein n=1 Tax=Cordylochernes scorpioides TaxID=51811 RepID=A0ABY6KB77_9ARAC|nr:hypothetical protein LAZ67_3002733 [Cordylochernes scorpioides]